MTNLPAPVTRASETQNSVAIVDLPGTIAPPVLVHAHGKAADYAWEEFLGQLRNPHTRAAYVRAVQRFLDWLGPRQTPLTEISPGMIASYLDYYKGGIPTRKLHLAALRRFFDLLVLRHVIVLNPAASVRGERYSVVEGKTPEITVEQARRLLASIALTTIIGLRDRAIIATLCYTAARAGAVTRLRKKDFLDDGTQMLLLFDEKGGKQRAIPCRHDLQLMIRAYLDAGGWSEWDKDAPLFRTVCGPTGELTENAMTGIFICKMVKRRVRDAGLPDRLSPHSFRVAAITDLLRQNVPMEDVQYLCGHSSAATTRLYNRQSREVTRNTVERISI